MIKAFSRGHEIYFKDGNWFYSDNNEPFKDDIPCKKCNRYPTKEGYDACIGYIEGVSEACCGHGIKGEEYYKKIRSH